MLISMLNVKHVAPCEEGIIQMMEIASFIEGWSGDETQAYSLTSIIAAIRSYYGEIKSEQAKTMELLSNLGWFDYKIIGPWLTYYSSALSKVLHNGIILGAQFLNGMLVTHKVDTVPTDTHGFLLSIWQDATIKDMSVRSYAGNLFNHATNRYIVGTLILPGYSERLYDVIFKQSVIEMQLNHLDFIASLVEGE